MDLKNLLYYYYTEYLSELIKEIHIRDDWDGLDREIDYAQYLQEFINAEFLVEKMEKTIGRSLKDEECIKVFTRLSRTRLDRSYSDLSEIFLDYINSQKPLPVEDGLRYEKRLYQHREGNGFNLNFLKEMKKIEEEFLRG